MLVVVNFDLDEVRATDLCARRQPPHDGEVSQAAVAWVIATVFIRFSEDNGLLAGAELDGALLCSSFARWGARRWGWGMALPGLSCCWAR